jgi:hypothetical protein
VRVKTLIAMCASTMVACGLFALPATQAKSTAKTEANTWLVIIKEKLPETLTVFHNGKVYLRTLTNTGLPTRTTQWGTFHIYLKVRFQYMKGYNPNGSYYDVPVSYIWYFNGGDAIHAYPRAKYGFPQTDGCVELPPNIAANLWPVLPEGAEVIVEKP